MRLIFGCFFVEKPFFFGEALKGSIEFYLKYFKCCSRVLEFISIYIYIVHGELTSQISQAQSSPYKTSSSGIGLFRHD